MKKKIFLLTTLSILLSFTACTKQGAEVTPAPAATDTPIETTSTPTPTPAPTEAPEFIDFAGSIKLDMSSETVKTEATVRTYVDGDTVHFNVPASVSDTGLLKARFIAINTPESTGKVEEYGKTAAKFTKDTLSKATGIIIESDTSEWSLDSTGGRYLVWIWYKTAEDPEYRNLNIEILQNGLAIASSSANNRYGTTAVAALNNAKALKLNIYSGQKDPNFYYGDALELTLKELRLNPEIYNGVQVAFEGVVTMNHDSSVYVEDYDGETGLYYGMSVYYGYALSGTGLQILTVGNRVRVVGTCQYYEAGGTYQISGVSYREMKPSDPSNLQKISDGHTGAFTLTDPATFANDVVYITDEATGNATEYAYAYLALDTTVSMKDLTVKSIYTTSNPSSSSNGAMTISCEAPDGTKVNIRTVVFYDENHDLVTSEKYEGKNIDVRGVVEYFDGSYQIKVLSEKDITIN
jgi:endonuclease YncB( thermonuclease family)